MVKILVCGNIHGQWDQLISRVKVLQESAHGPFHVLLLAGRVDWNGCSSTIHSANISGQDISYASSTSSKRILKLKDWIEQLHSQSIVFPIPTYFYYPQDGVDETKLSEEELNLPENLHLLQSISYPKSSGLNFPIGICTLPNYLTVAFVNSTENTSLDPSTIDHKELLDIVHGVGYKGCDLLLSLDWPQDMSQCLDSHELGILQSTGSIAKTSVSGGLSKLGYWCNLLRSRYHFACGRDLFYQRPPYRNSSNSAANLSPCTRFISLSSVSESKEKHNKWLHALSLEPIIHLTNQEISEIPPGTTDNPFVDTGIILENRLSSHSQGLGKDGDHISKRMKFDESKNSTGQSTGTFFFGDTGVPRYQTSSSQQTRSSTVLIPPTPTAKQLFIGGLSRDIIESDLLSALPGASQVKRPSGKSFAFVEFDSHESAVKVVSMAAKRSGGWNIKGKNVTVGWATLAEAKETSIELSNPSTESLKTLFVGGLSLSFSDDEILQLFPGSIAIRKIPGKSFVFIDFESVESAESILRGAVDHSITYQGQKLALGWAKGDTKDSSSALLLNTKQPSLDSRTLFVGSLSHSVTNDDIQDLFPSVESIRRPKGKDFAFIEFSSPKEAHEIISLSMEGQEYKLQGKAVSIGWAKGKPADSLAVSSHAGNCWFCLASPTIKVHLIVSVGQGSYLALPKGGLVDAHVLIVPIECVPSRIHLSSDAKAEIERYEVALQQMFAQQNQEVIFYERAIRTKGRDHMQEHVIPITKSQISQALSIFMQLAHDFKLKFHEITDNRDVDDVVLHMDGGPYQEYFYISLPTTDIGRSKRFVYVHEDQAKQFQMFFGNEVTAKIIGRPERSNWKNCVVSEDEEHNLAEKFRNLFEKFDFTLS